MRTTLAMDDDVSLAAEEMARLQGKTIREISTLARQALQPAPGRRRTRNGVPLLSARPGGRRVTSELVQRLREDLP